MIEELLNELIEGQKKKLLTTAQKIVPHITGEDLLQPNDFPALELHPYFRYEEGILHGLQVAKAAMLAKKAGSAHEKFSQNVRLSDPTFDLEPLVAESDDWRRDRS